MVLNISRCLLSYVSISQARCKVTTLWFWQIFTASAWHSCLRRCKFQKPPSQMSFTTAVWNQQWGVGSCFSGKKIIEESVLMELIWSFGRGGKEIFSWYFWKSKWKSKERQRMESKNDRLCKWKCREGLWEGCTKGNKGRQIFLKKISSDQQPFWPYKVVHHLSQQSYSHLKRTPGYFRNINSIMPLSLIIYITHLRN